MNSVNNNVSNNSENKVIEGAAKVTKRLDGNEVVIEIRVPAYFYVNDKEWTGTQYGECGSPSTSR